MEGVFRKCTKLNDRRGMVRIDLYKAILIEILDSFSGLADTSPDYQDIKDYIDVDDVVSAASRLIVTTSLSSFFHPWLLSIRNIDTTSLNDSIQPAFKKTALFEKWEGEKKYERCFCYCSPSLFVVDADFIYKQSINRQFSQQLWIYLERLCSRKSDMKVLLKAIERQKHGTYILAYNKLDLGFTLNAKVKNEELFSYAYSASLHGKEQVDLHKGLEFDVNTIRLNPFIYNKNVVYLQYYDIYDVINDWLQAKDILSAFLRMYQIVEFLIYRQQMSDIIKVSSIKQSFLREVKKLNRKFELSEKETIVNNIPILFGPLSATNASIDRAEPFIRKYLGQNKAHTHGYLYSTMGVNEKSTALARFIYDMRCSIVHNKEAEFHISYNNYAEYKSVLPLLKEVHSHLAIKIWDLMNQPGSIISYEKNRYIDLF